MDLEHDGNLIEAGVWFLLALALLIYALRPGRGNRGRLMVLAATLAVFGGSDLVEARTGAWWRPWWLLVWKGICVIILSVGFTQHYRWMKRGGAGRGSAASGAASKANPNPEA